MITHVVVFWTKNENANREELLKGTEILKEIPGVLEFRRGLAVPSERDVVDDSFAVAISMTFADQATADNYQAHPIHDKFVAEYVKPLVSRVIVYDFG